MMARICNSNALMLFVIVELSGLLVRCNGARRVEVSRRHVQAVRTASWS